MVMAMTVKELRDQLNALSPEQDDHIVICQSDAEGNSYSPLHELDTECIYIPETTWSGEAYSMNFSAEDMCVTESEWEEMKQESKRCVVLAPTN